MIINEMILNSKTVIEISSYNMHQNKGNILYL